MSLYRVWLLDCNLEPTSGVIFEEAITRWAPADFALERVRIPDTDGASWAAKDRLQGRCDGLIISGSAAAIQSGPPWVEPLAATLRELTGRGIPTLGICFGHQILAYAWGGEIAEDRLGYKIRAVTDVDVLNDTAQSSWLFAPDETNTQIQALSSHRDQVLTAPPGWHILAQTALCPIQALCAPDLPIVSVQWHPEADPAFIIENPHPDWDHLAQQDLTSLSGNQVLARFFARLRQG